MALGPAALVAGCGPAGLAAAAVLARDGWSVTLAGAPSRAGRLVTLNRGVVDLITDLFGAAALSRAGGWTARRRLLDWDPAIGEVRIDEPTVMVEVHRLAEAMRSALAPALADAEGDPGTPAAPAVPAIEAFGRAGMAPLLRSAPRTTVVWRDASGAVAAALRATRADTLVRATRDGWVFAADVPDGAAFAQVSVPSCPAPTERAAAVLSDALGEPLAAADLPPPLPVDTTPCLGRSLSPAGALKAGDAVLSMDPLSGDGIGSAMRSGILAAGVFVRRARTPAEAPMLHAHYDRRLLTAFGAHLDRCAEFYAASRLADTWRDAIEEMEREGARIRELGARSRPDLYRNDAGVLHPRYRTGR